MGDARILVLEGKVLLEFLHFLSKTAVHRTNNRSCYQAGRGPIDWMHFITLHELQ